MDAKQWDERYATKELVWGAEPNQFVKAQCEGLTPGMAIDLACGEGRNALWLARSGWQVTGVDFSAVGIERARALTAEEPPDVAARLHWRVGDVTRAHEDPAVLAPGRFDLVLISYLHLMSDLNARVMLAGAGAVAPGGHLLIVGHDLRNLHEGVSGPQDEDRLYEPGAIRELLAGVPGLIVELAETVVRKTPDGDALDTLVRASR